MKHTHKHEFDLEIPDEFIEKWQSIMDIAAELIGVPAGLIMRIVDEDIKVFISSHSEGNPYKPGDSEHLIGSGLYCEKVISTQGKLLIPNALTDEDWKDNPDVKLNMISYLGFPITLANGVPFGTICVLDSNENSYNDTYEKLILNFRDIIHSQLELFHSNQVLGENYKNLSDYTGEIEKLRRLIPICANCKKIRDDEGFWNSVEDYFADHAGAQFTHTICSDCFKEFYPEIADEYPKS
ncbi:MAG: GAF domain-containing protein [Calditrichaeota bacterium]|nr:GAF domain-containing protein [Calditrichota bacterium]MBT7617991.1 GAF domain-containing protein [Calditrichota bacterium]